MLASRAETPLNTAAGPAELRRLRDEYKGVAILHVPNLAQATDLHSSGVLGPEERKLLGARFGMVGGSWCCAPSEDERAHMPKNHGFHLELVPRELPELRAGEAQDHGASLAGSVEDAI